MSLHPSQVCILNVSDRTQASLPEAGCSEIGTVPEHRAESAWGLWKAVEWQWQERVQWSDFPLSNANLAHSVNFTYVFIYICKRGKQVPQRVLMGLTDLMPEEPGTSWKHNKSHLLLRWPIISVWAKVSDINPLATFPNL